jgi:geranylgeranyl diphosphate synthase type I
MTGTLTVPLEYGPRVEAEMRAILSSPSAPFEPLYGMMHYHLGWVDEGFSPRQAYPGKLVRPSLLLLSCEAVGGDWKAALPAAAAVELLHNFSLIHDDIEDDSLTRRGRPTVWSLWGIAHAINVGDVMFSHAYKALSRLHRNGITRERTQEAYGLLNEACISLCQGQYLDLAFERRAEVDVALYLQMIENKTASLIACSAEMGALVGGANPSVVRRYRRFGQELGIGFQIMDDILGIWGDPELTGKPACDDLRAKKKTLPVLHSMAQEKEPDAGTLRDLYCRDQIGEPDIEGMLEALERTASREHARVVLRERRHKALRELEALGVLNEAQQKLASLSRSILDREY